MKLILLISFITLVCSFQVVDAKDNHRDNRPDKSLGASDSIVKPNYAEYWVSLDFLKSLEKEIFLEPQTS